MFYEDFVCLLATAGFFQWMPVVVCGEGEMINPLLVQLFALSAYVLWMGFTFCDGFKLPVFKKLICFGVFLAVSIVTFLSGGPDPLFHVPLILGISSLTAFFVCWHHVRGAGKK